MQALVRSLLMLAVELIGVNAGYVEAGAFSLHDVSMALQSGQLCAVLGGNGAGKSTLLRVVAGALSPAVGLVRVLGDTHLDQRQRSQRIAFVPQRNEVALGFSVRDVVAMGRAPHQGALMRQTSDDEVAVRRAIDTCELRHLVDRPVAELSGGEQQRVHIARAFAQQSPILLLDEAAAHLDVKHALNVYRLVRSEIDARKMACLAVMHDLAAAARHADTAILLHEGRVLADGPVEQVMTSALLSEAFATPIEVGETQEGQRYFLAT